MKPEWCYEHKRFGAVDCCTRCAQDPGHRGPHRVCTPQPVGHCDGDNHQFIDGHLLVDGPGKTCACGQMEVYLTYRGLQTRTAKTSGLVPLVGW
jgi:hypothetical protein